MLLDRLSDVLATLTGSSGRASFDPADMALPGAVMLVAYDRDGSSVGCGAIRPLGDGVCEIKRMFALPGSKGVGHAVLEALERRAIEAGFAEAWLETRRINDRAVRFYLSHAYRPIESYGKYMGRDECICLGKRLNTEFPV